MRAIRRLNNNAVVCMDSTGREAIALGKGLGFGDIPRELKLSEVERTFYDLDEGGVNVMNDLPVDVVMFAAKIIDIAVGELSYELSPNAVLLLADHLNFALERVKKNIRVKMPLAYDVKQLYPLEYKIGKYAVDKARKEFRVGLANDEAVGIAMNLINAKKTPSDRPDPEADFSQMLEEVTEIVEDHFHVMVDRESFNFTAMPPTSSISSSGSGRTPPSTATTFGCTRTCGRSSPPSPPVWRRSRSTSKKPGTAPFPRRKSSTSFPM